MFTLTAAFDSVDHDLLLLRFEFQNGLRGVVLSWFRSYLTGRLLRVAHAHDGRMSSTVHISCSVPQGSVLGPRLFILYTADLADKAAEHDVILHAFADDTQLYLHCCREDMTATIKRL